VQKKYHTEEDRKAAHQAASRASYQKRHPKKSVPAPRPRAPKDAAPDAPAPKYADPLRPQAISCGAVTPSRISHLRGYLWTLLADLERMSPEDRSALAPETSLLDAASHAVHALATGRLAVA